MTTEDNKIVYIDADTSDYSIVYYAFDTYTKINCAYKYYSNNDNSFEANEIIPGIYLGGINSVYDINKLKELNITHIISAIAGFDPPYPKEFNYLVVNALDNENTNLSKIFDKTNDFINETFFCDKKILIHCQAGRSRSTTILAAYLIKLTGNNVKNIISSIKCKRNIIEPNKYFLEQLESYRKELFHYKK
jgi:protein-tyrosine phosphatase